MKESQKKTIPGQLDIFAEESAFEKERAEIAQKYKVVDPKKLTKEGDEWYINGYTVKEWDKIHSNEGLKYWQR